MKSNHEIAKILQNTALFYEMRDIPFKPRAYERAAEVIESLDQELAEVWQHGGKKALDQIPSIGPAIAKHLESILKTGTFKEYETMRQKIPVNLDELTAVEGIGPKTIKILWKKLGVKNLKDLERAAAAHQISKLPGFGQKSEEKILKGIEFQKQSQGRFLLGEVKSLVETLEIKIKKIPGVSQVMTCGSYRRWQETVGDIDLQAAAKNPEKVIKAFVKFPEV
ncbi:MAG: helix-hairpin-helix domain-containing protein, partial [bacterium]|nr:helix-hairpin-helix domain-containing protein [bacterium]